MNHVTIWCRCAAERKGPSDVEAGTKGREQHIVRKQLDGSDSPLAGVVAIIA